MEIYFDNKLINEDYYTELSTNFALFSDIFYLGSTASNTYNLSIAKEAITIQPETVTIKDSGVLIATLVVDNVEENDFEYKYTLTDKMVNLEFNYDASQIFTNGSATLLEIAQDICNKAGIELATMNFRGYDKGINWYDNTRTAREYIGYIAELNGGYAQIGKDGKLYFIKQNTPSVKTISIDDCSDFKIGEKHIITRVVYEQGALKYEYGDETGNTLYLSGDNVYITDQIEVEEIFNEINGFEFYSFSTSNCPIDYNVIAGEIITFTDGTNNYPTIVGYELTYNGDWYGGYNLDVATKKQEETQVTGPSEKIRNLTIKVDRESNKITQAVKEIDNQNQKISVVEQTVNELNSKIGDIADITTSKESTNATVGFEKINQSEPIYVRIYPIGENISYLYPCSNLYPSETLFMPVRTLRFTNTTTNEYFDYELSNDLLYYDAENYDEFILDYDAQSCVVNKRVGYKADGTTYILETLKTIEYEYPRIELTDGDYTIELLGYANAYLFVRLMAQNIYTTQFATKAEVNSEISQTAEEIGLSVDKKLTSYPTTTQMNSAISVKANEITNSVSETYETKSNATTNYSKLTQTANSLQSQISANDTEISTLKQTANSISSEVSKKVGNDEIISKINQSAESVQINANKISLAGKTINLTSDNTVIKSNNFNVDKSGNMTCNNATINGGKIQINTATVTGEAFRLYHDNGYEVILDAGRMWFHAPSNKNAIYFQSANDDGAIVIHDASEDKTTDLYGSGIFTPYLDVSGMAYAQQFVPTSKESKKKNISKYSEKALDIVKDSEIYTYNFKSENDKDKKHIGFVIGDEGGEYKTPEQVISSDREGIESYSMTSILWKAFQEYIAEKDEQIQQLQNEIKEMKGEK